jgi:hypothetical protein
MAEARAHDVGRLSVLATARRSDVVSDPYPYLIIENALPAALCDDLIASYPAPSVVGAGSRSNQRWSLPTAAALGAPGVPALWQDFVGYHASARFFDEVCDVFGEAIVRQFPRRFPDEDAVRQLVVGMRKRDSFDRAELLLDAQIAGNTPVTAASSVKTVHVDSGNKLFTALLYLRLPEDDAQGGDLQVVRFRRDLSAQAYARRFNGMFVDDALVEPVATVPYRRNVLFMFVNGLEALHGVTVREPTPHRRLFLNLVGEMKRPLFDVPQHWTTRLRKLPRLARKRVRGMFGRDVEDDA